MRITRRQVLKTGLTLLPAVRMGMLIAEPLPDSKFDGVQIGIIVSPYRFPSLPLAADQLLPLLVQLGFSAVELQDLRCELYAGAPCAQRPGYSGSPDKQLTAQQLREETRKQAEELTQWRLRNTAAILNKYRALRKMYQDAGVKIYAFRAGNIRAVKTDAEFDYFFEAAKALGANQVTMELPHDPALSERVGSFAAKHHIMAGYHNHLQVNAHSWDTALAQSKWNGIQLDVGHFTAAINGSPIPFLREHADRITSIHLKDRKYLNQGGQNLPWGQGETPLKQVLLTMRDQQYKFPAGIELEYPIPAGSTPRKEIEKCLDFCRQTLA